MQNAEPTLHDFVLKLLTEAPCRQAFDLDPVAALRDAGLSDASPQDVVDAIPLVLDFANASGDAFHLGGSIAGSVKDFSFDGGFAASPDGLAGGGGFESPFGGAGLRAEGGLDGADIAAGAGSDLGGAQLDVSASPHGGLAISQSFNSPFGGGGFDLALGLDGVSGGGGFELCPPDGLGGHDLGNVGDLVTGTVAGYINDGAESFASALTDGAGMLADGVTKGAETKGGLVPDGAGQLSDGVQDPTSIGAPAMAPAAGLPHLPVDVPEVPAMPGAPGVPGLGDLPIDLPVELPELPAVPGLPATPALPSVPEVGGVQDVVGGVTGHVPVVSDLTDGLSDGLLGH
ncbi:MAG TPA: IniB N-terminal domain-containing protein [Actinophytocola sp.]|uniref:IniB N-terminal domain-containing protein n=1 Tax=Actinophytocola sp. TaxID=1872138 RepID=UPI002DDD1273|nr:IniB N-terminal domain-containing protein [Actinophytocola sp.]HEV2782903.1 IniB N-terminal domain-containing protein [Actinophytocola sp.]